MTRPENLFEQASYDLNKFRERRIAERRSVPRDTGDRRASRSNGLDASAGERMPGEKPREEKDGGS